MHGVPSLPLSLKAEYASLRLQLAFISPTSAAAALPPAINVFRGSIAALDKLAPGSSALNALVSRMRYLSGSLYGGAEPGFNSPVFAAAVAELAESEIERLQTALTHSAQQVSSLQQVCLLACWCAPISHMYMSTGSAPRGADPTAGGAPG